MLFSGQAGAPIAADVVDDGVGTRVDAGGGEDAAGLHFVTGDAVVLDEVVASGGGGLGAAGQIDAGFENLGIGGAVIAAEAGGIFVAAGGVQAGQAGAGGGMGGTGDEEGAGEGTGE